MVILERFIVALAFMLLMATVSSAEEWEIDLSAGDKSVTAGVHDKSYLDSGYYRIGGSGLYTDDEETEYKWVSLDLTVGSDTLSPGLSCDVGLRGIGGVVNEEPDSGDVGLIGFSLAAAYLFPKELTVIPFELSGNLTWSPDPLAFLDTEEFLEFNFGVGVRIIKNASVIATYSNYHVEMNSGPGDWTLNDEAFRVGVVLRF
jgi:hypothetical protein